MPAKHLHKIHKHKNSTNSLLLSLIYIISIVEPLATLPQVYTIWIKKQTEGVSILSWGGFLSAACIWLVYGFTKKDKAIIISSTAWIITEGLVVIGLLIYR